MRKILFLSFAVLAMTFSACDSDEPTTNDDPNTEQTDPEVEDPENGDSNEENGSGNNENGEEDPEGGSGNTGEGEGNTEDETYEDGVYVISASTTTAAYGDIVTFTIKGNDVADKMWFLCSYTMETCFGGITFVDGVGDMEMSFEPGTVDFYAHYYEGAEEICTNAVEILITE